MKRWGMRRKSPKHQTKRQRILAQMAEIVDVRFKINETRAASWREQIVEEELRRDGAA